MFREDGVEEEEEEEEEEQEEEEEKEEQEEEEEEEEEGTVAETSRLVNIVLSSLRLKRIL